jgi:hypothetical protein
MDRPAMTVAHAAGTGGGEATTVAMMATAVAVSLPVMTTAGTPSPAAGVLSHSADGRIGPMQPPNRLALREDRLVSLWERSVTTLGVDAERTDERRGRARSRR